MDYLKNRSVSVLLLMMLVVGGLLLGPVVLIHPDGTTALPRGTVVYTPHQVEIGLQNNWPRWVGRTVFVRGQLDPTCCQLPGLTLYRLHQTNILLGGHSSALPQRSLLAPLWAWLNDSLSLGPAIYELHLTAPLVCPTPTVPPSGPPSGPHWSCYLIYQGEIVIYQGEIVAAYK